MSKKPILPSTASYEELLAAMEQEETIITEEVESQPLEIPEVLEYDNNVIPFLSHYQIQPGEYLVSKSQLYTLYKQHVQDPIPALNFHRIVGQFIGHYRNHSGNFYKINIHQFKLSEYMFKIRVGKIKKVDKSKGWRRHFESFLKKKEIEKGNNWLEGYILQEIYRDFCRDRKKRPALGYENFLKMARLYFEHKRVSSTRAVFFKINDKTYNYFTEERKNEFREERRSKKVSKAGNKTKTVRL